MSATEQTEQETPVVEPTEEIHIDCSQEQLEDFITSLDKKITDTLPIVAKVMAKIHKNPPKQNDVYRKYRPFLKYTRTRHHQHNVFDDKGFGYAMLDILNQIKKGGFDSEDTWTKFIKDDGRPPIIITHIKTISCANESDNTMFANNFIEVCYCSDRQYTDLFNLITTKDFQKQLTHRISQYNYKLHKGLHYIYNEISYFKQSIQKKH